MNPGQALAQVLVEEFARLGVREAVIAPGSRSAPLALALYREPRIRVHVRIDERSAAFVALGLAKASGRAALAVCTSGSAAANFHPAVIEADQAGVPLVVLTADRPAELRHTGANQTIDQVKLFGSAVRWSCEVPAAENRPGMVAYWRSLAGRALAYAGFDPGPVHVNVAFREPLVGGEHPAWVEPLSGRSRGRAWTVPPAAVSSPELDLGELPERGVLVVGDTTADPARYVALAEQAGWPVLSEPSGNARYGAHAIGCYPDLLAVEEFTRAHRADLVVTLGRVGLSRSLAGYVAAAREQVVVAATPRFADPTRSASAVAGGVRGRGRGAGGWLASWQRCAKAAEHAIDAVLDSQAVSEVRLARDLAAALPQGALLFAGSSMPIRDLERVMRPRRGVRVLANRGAAGIDGSVSSAVGAALAHGGPAFALLGDLAFVHDHNGLVLGNAEPRPDLVIVVVNNDGGGIFSMLPYPAAGPQTFERMFATPHGVELSALAAASAVPHVAVGELSALGEALQGEGLRVVEVVTDREVEARRRARLGEAARQAVREALT